MDSPFFRVLDTFSLLTASLSKVQPGQGVWGRFKAMDDEGWIVVSLLEAQGSRHTVNTVYKRHPKALPSVKPSDRRHLHISNFMAASAL